MNAAPRREAAFLQIFRSPSPIITRGHPVTITPPCAVLSPFLATGFPFREAKARVVEAFERAYVTGVLEAHGGKLTAAAKHADMDPKNLYEKLTRYGLRRPAGGSPGEQS